MHHLSLPLFCLLLALLSGCLSTAPVDAPDDTPTPEEWLPSWATTMQRTEPRNLPPSLQGNTLRQFVWPTVSGTRIRIQLSNESGSTPLHINKVHIARAPTEGNPSNSGGRIDTATDAAFLFDGVPEVIIPAGETVWSDALDFSLDDLQLTAISIHLGAQVPAEITGHPGARTTSYITDGDAVSREVLPGAKTRDRWYFINAIEVMAPADAFAIAFLGDSITDGYGILNDFARWPDFLTLALKEHETFRNNRSVLNFGMGGNNLTVSDEHQDAGLLRFKRDVLTRDKIKWLIVLQGVNDIVYSNVEAQPIIDAYQKIIDEAQARGIRVYGSPITPMGAANAEKEPIRSAINEWVRTSGAFDAAIDFDAVLRDPDTPSHLRPRYRLDDLHPNKAGYQAMSRAVDLSLFER